MSQQVRQTMEATSYRDSGRHVHRARPLPLDPHAADSWATTSVNSTGPELHSADPAGQHQTQQAGLVEGADRPAKRSVSTRSAVLQRRKRTSCTTPGGHHAPSTRPIRIRLPDLPPLRAHEKPLFGVGFVLLSHAAVRPTSVVGDGGRGGHRDHRRDQRDGAPAAFGAPLPARSRSVMRRAGCIPEGELQRPYPDIGGSIIAQATPYRGWS